MATAPVLDFEKPIVELERQVEELRRAAGERSVDMEAELGPLEARLSTLRQEVYRTLTPLQRVQVARMSRRPFTSDYLRLAFTDFLELHGDRLFREDAAIMGGWAGREGERALGVPRPRVMSRTSCSVEADAGKSGIQRERTATGELIR